MPSLKAGQRERCPTHPGAVLRRALEDLGVSGNQAALAMGISRQRFNLLLNEKGPVKADTALLIAAYLGTGDNGAEHLLGMQMDYDLWHERRKLKSQLAKVVPAPRKGA